MTALVFWVVLACTPAWGMAAGKAAGAARSGAAEWTAYASIWKEKQPAPAALQTIVDLLAKELDNVAKEAPEGSAESQRGAALKQRIDLLRQWLELLGKRAAVTRQAVGLADQKEEVDRQLKALSARPPPEAPKQPTAEEFQQIKATLADRASARETLITEQNDRQQLLQEIPQRILQAREQAQAAAERAQNFTRMSKNGQESQQRVLTIQIGNAELERRLALEAVDLWQAEEVLEKQLAPVRDGRLEMARLALEAAEQRFQLYQAALQHHQDVFLQTQALELQEMRRAAAAAKTPQDQFLARWEIHVILSQTNSAEFQKVKVDILAEISDQERRLQAERQEVEDLRGLVEQFGTRGPAAALLKATYHLLDRRQRELDRPLPTVLEARHADIQGRRVAVSNQLATLFSAWQQEIQPLLDALPESQRPAFDSAARALLERLRHTLGEEKRLALEIGVEWQRLALLPRERRQVLTDLEGIVFTKVFWIQEHEPLSLDLVWQARDELFSTANPQSLWSLLEPALVPGNWLRWGGAFQETAGLLLAGGGFMILAIATGYFRRRLHRTVTGRAGQPTPLPGRNLLRALFLAGLHAGAYPVLLMVATVLINATDLPGAYRLVFFRFCWLLAQFFFLWGVGNWFLQRPSPFSLGLLLSRERVRTLVAAWRWILLSGLTLLLPFQVFSQEPFDFQAIPRLLFTVFEFSATLTLFLIIRPGSPFFRPAAGNDPPPEGRADGKPGLLAARSSWIRRSMLVFATAVLALDMLGFRFTAGYLARNGVLTILILLGLWGLFNFLEVLVGQWRPSLRGVPPEQRSGLIRHRREALARLLRILTGLIGLLLLTSLWGLHEQALAALREVNLYSVRSAEGDIAFVTVADLLRFALVLAATFWGLAKLPLFFDWLVFSRWRVGEGSRFAIVTMTRYLLFLVALFVTIPWLRLDLAQVAWLVAAISVGLGFGLQEIVANFVSGIILLLERPIRVGDLIAVGAVQGRVTRVNIRATTVQNLDLQEILIPNRDLITKEVTNWTLSNPRTRLVIAIGVAYGSPVERVKEILLELARQQEEVLADPAPEAFFIRHGESSLDFELRVYLATPAQRLPALDRLNTLINARFTREGIVMPFPQRELHIHPHSATTLSATQARE
ncbi:MAG: mechanosensitive ion channel [Magnetococcales bacterium]|nr:mechanosensitive ion channel [Magnetococcales bacterium]